jgi:YD repeat-containing protein
MRYAKLLPWLLAAVFFAAACATQAPAPEKIPEEEAQEPEMREVSETVYLVKQELSYFPEGVLDRYRVYTYPEDGSRLLEEELYNAEDQLQERVEYRYEDGLQTEEAVYNGAGELLRLHRYSYDEQGNMTEDALYDANDELQSRSEYRYDEQGRKIEWRVYNGSGGLLAYTEYLYEDGRNTRIENYRPGGELEDYFEIEYDAQGRKIRSTWYDSEDEVVQYRTFSYGSSGLEEEVVHRANGSVKLRILYRNDEAGNPVAVRYEEADGDLRELVNYEYITRTETRMVRSE